MMRSVAQYERHEYDGPTTVTNESWQGGALKYNTASYKLEWLWCLRSLPWDQDTLNNFAGEVSIGLNIPSPLQKSGLPTWNARKKVMNETNEEMNNIRAFLEVAASTSALTKTRSITRQDPTHPTSRSSRSINHVHSRGIVMYCKRQVSNKLEREIWQKEKTYMIPRVNAVQLVEKLETATPPPPTRRNSLRTQNPY